MARGNIFIAEDDPVLRSLYAKKFTVAGFAIRTGADGEEAIKMIEEDPPDLAILDIHMPKIDGFQVLEHFPRASRSFPVILLTNFGDEKFRARGKELGADDFFVKKDMTIRSLVDMVDHLLGNR